MLDLITSLRFTLIDIALLIILFVIYVKKRKKAGNSEEERPEKSNIGFILMIFTMMQVILIPVLSIVGFSVRELWFSFDEKRTAVMERQFGIVIDENIDLKCYSHVTSEPAIRLDFETTLSPDEFVRNNMGEHLWLNYTDLSDDEVNEDEEGLFSDEEMEKYGITKYKREKDAYFSGSRKNLPIHTLISYNIKNGRPDIESDETVVATLMFYRDGDHWDAIIIYLLGHC